MGVTASTSQRSPSLPSSTRNLLPVVVPCGLSLLVVIWLTNSITTALSRSASTTPPAWAVAAALGVALGTGLLFGVLPARRAARLDPVQALARR